MMNAMIHTIVMPAKANLSTTPPALDFQPAIQPAPNVPITTL